MIYIDNIVDKNRRKLGEKEHPAVIPRDVQYFWRDGDKPECPAYKNHALSAIKQGIFTILRHR